MTQKNSYWTLLPGQLKIKTIKWPWGWINFWMFVTLVSHSVTFQWRNDLKVKSIFSFFYWSICTIIWTLIKVSTESSRRKVCLKLANKLYYTTFDNNVHINKFRSRKLLFKLIHILFFSFFISRFSWQFVLILRVQIFKKFVLQLIFGAQKHLNWRMIAGWLPDDWRMMVKGFMCA